MTVPVQIEGVERRFGRRVAVAGVHLTITGGEIVGLVGPNGSGKTTLLKLLAGLARPSRGQVRLFGLDPHRHRASAMRRARFAFAPPALFENLTAAEHLRYLPALSGERSDRPAQRDIERALAQVGLADRARDRVGTFSFGMRQRLALAQTLLPMPELIVLDEPTDGLDPLAVLELRAILLELRRDHGVTILLSSHLLLEIDQLVDRMLVMKDGQTLFCGAPADLHREGARLRIEASPLEVAATALARQGVIATREVRGGGLLLAPQAVTLEDAQAILAAAGARLLAFHETRPTLEEALLHRLRLAPSAAVSR